MYGDAAEVDNEKSISGNAYSVITPLRMLLMMDSNCDKWKRSNQLMDHIDGKQAFNTDFHRRNHFLNLGKPQ